MIEASPSKRLLERANPFRGDCIGIGLQHISKIALTADVIAEITACLDSGDSGEVGWGQWFALGLLDSHLPQQLLLRLVREIPGWLEHPEERIREHAVQLLIRLRDSFPNYRELM